MNIRELARLSGVSIATVSRALNGRGEVSEATRHRILELARDLGYAPNEPARTLVRRRSDTIGLVWDTGYERLGLHHPFLHGLLSGVRSALSDAGYHLMLLTTAADDDPEDTYLRAVRRHNLEGVVVMGARPEDRAVQALARADVPCVGIDVILSGPRTARVASDNRAGASAAVRHLHALGHRRIATITGPPHMPPGAERLEGFRSECAALGVEVPDEYVACGDFYLSSGQQAMRGLLGLDRPPTAVFAAGDHMAIGALHAASEAGYAVPSDVAVIGFDDIDAARLVRPALSTLAQDERALGVMAVEALRTMLDDPDTPGPATDLVVPVRLTVRGSTQDPSGTRPARRQPVRKPPARRA